MSILHTETITWRRRGGAWKAVAPGGLDTRLDEQGLSSPGGLLALHHDRGFTQLVDERGATRIRVRRVTDARAAIDTAGGRYRVSKQLMKPIWDVTPEVAGEPIVQVLAVGPLLRLRPADGADELTARELSDLHKGVIVAIQSCRRSLPLAGDAAAAA